MGSLIYVYGDAVELEDALRSLAAAGLAEHGRVIEGRAADASNGRPGRERLAGHYPDSDPQRPVDVVDDTIAGAGVVPPAAALGSHVPLGSAGAGPYALVAATDDAVDFANSGERADLDALVGGNREEAEHYADVLRGGGSLLLIEADEQELDQVEQALAPHDGQGSVRR